jgi:cbb3-type cytochrome oxidase cytochrome c subunit
MGRRFIPALLVVVAVITLIGYYVGYYIATASDGAEVFKRENCGKCHSLRGEGIGLIDLTGISGRRSRAWMRDQIVNPRLHDPHPGMPSFAHLSDREIAALIDYIEGE